MERKMRQGALLVKTRQVPAYASLQISEQFEKPAPPKVKVHSVAGHDEIKDAPTDSPEWEDYARLVHEYDAHVERAGSDFLYDYGVEAWSWDNGATWLTEPPDDWTFPDVFLRHGMKPSDNRRVDYIRFELITSNEDAGQLWADALGQTAPITNSEVSAASAGFRSDTQREQSASGKAKWYQRFKWAVQRNGNRA